MTQHNAMQFSADLTKWSQQLRGRIDEAVRNIAFQLAEEVIVGGDYSPGSPVDTGFFRSSWQAGIGSPPEAGPSENPDPKKRDWPSRLDEVSLILAKVKAGPTVYMLNPVVYGNALEFGWSQQAPQGMVRIAVARGQEIVDDVVRQMQ